MQFCSSRKIDRFNPNIKEVLLFLTQLFENGVKYSGVNTARSALSSLLEITSNIQIGTHFLVKRLLKAIFLKAPTLPRYKNTWDVEKVLNYISSLGANENLDLTSLSYKVALLLALSKGQRCQTLYFIDTRNIEFCSDGVKIRIGDLLKQSSANRHLDEMFIKYFNENTNLCTVT